MGKTAIYNPYLDTLGGGERYTITFAKVLAEAGFDVDIEWSDPKILTKLSERFGLKLPNNIRVVDSINRGENYDICFWVSDGSIPTLRSRKNYIHFQVPFHNIKGNTLLNKMKLFRVNNIICNSNFTKNIIDAEYKLNSTVIYPPVDVNMFKSKRKIDQICYVGRFSKLIQSKGHNILIEQFKELVKLKKFKDWKLVLAGGIEVGATDYLNDLKTQAKGYNIQFFESPTIEILKQIFGESKIFWSASGYGVDEEKDPEKTEHFGITLVESMSAGCVPIVYSAGGHKEIVEDSKNGFLWKTKEDLISITAKVIAEKGLLQKISSETISRSKNFDYESFKKQVLQIIS